MTVDNNAAERALRQVALGRKNWVFAGSDDGARRAAVIYSLVGSTLACGLNPHEYLRGVLVQMAEDPSRAAELTPKAVAAAKSTN